MSGLFFKNLFTKNTLINFVSISLLAFSLSACASTQNTVQDPFEPVNRVMFGVHNTLDKAILKPTAQVYGFLPEPARDGVGNFFFNLGEPFTMINGALQGKFDKAGTALARFSVNTTIGIGGLFDVASRMGLEKHKEDFGQTLGHYGMGPGPYLFIPVLGPSSIRDGAGQLATAGLDSTAWDEAGVADSTYVGMTALAGIHARHGGLTLLDEIEKSSVDYYASVRSLYLQNRASAIQDGETNIDDLPDLDELDELDAFDDDAYDAPNQNVRPVKEPDYK